MVFSVLSLMWGCAAESVDSASVVAPTPPEPARWMSVTWHPCAHHRDGRVRCWNASQWTEYQRVDDSPWPVAFYVVDSSAAWGTPVGSGLAEGWDRASIDQYPTPPVALVSGGPDCGVTPVGGLECWGPNPAPPDGSGAILVGEQGGPLVLHGSGRLTYGGRWPGPLVDVQIDRPDQVIAVAASRKAGCVLRPWGEVECLPGEEAELEEPVLAFDHPPYRLLDGTKHHVCAARESGVIDCSDGSTYDFGPLVDLDIRWHQSEDDEEERSLLNLCVLTVADRIECVGPRYKPRLMEKVWEEAG